MAKLFPHWDWNANGLPFRDRANELRWANHSVTAEAAAITVQLSLIWPINSVYTQISVSVQGAMDYNDLMRDCVCVCVWVCDVARGHWFDCGLASGNVHLENSSKQSTTKSPWDLIDHKKISKTVKLENRKIESEGERKSSKYSIKLSRTALSTVCWQTQVRAIMIHVWTCKNKSCVWNHIYALIHYFLHYSLK